MKSKDIKNRLQEIAATFVFEYNGINCGVDPYSEDEYELWCKEESLTVHSIEDVMNTTFFVGKSLNEISEEIDIIEI